MILVNGKRRQTYSVHGGSGYLDGMQMVTSNEEVEEGTGLLICAPKTCLDVWQMLCPITCHFALTSARPLLSISACLF